MNLAYEKVQELATQLTMLKGILNWKLSLAHIMMNKRIMPTAIVKLGDTSTTLFLPAEVLNTSLEQKAEELVQSLQEAGVELNDLLYQYVAATETLEQQNENPIDKGRDHG